MDLFLENLFKPEYKESTRFLYKLQFSGIKLGLNNIKTFLEHLGNPHQSLRYIHFSGTNGKGSTLAYMENILQEAGYKVGAYSSPHLVSFQERIRVNGRFIPLHFIHQFVQNHKEFITKKKLTFFEATTGLAFSWFAVQEPDVVLLESGLGGRLDSTNVVHAPLCVITHVDFDHEPYLGNTLEKIAKEKAGIIFSGSSAFSYNRNTIVQEVLSRRCREVCAEYHEVSDQSYIKNISMSTDGTQFDYQSPEMTIRHLKTQMPGSLQLKNIELAIYTLTHQTLFKIDKAHIQAGIKNTIWPGRLQRLHQSPDIFADAGHNADGFQNTLLTLNQIRQSGRLTVVCGIVNDKNAQQIAKTIETYADKVYLVSFDSPRFLPSNEFSTFFKAQEKISITDQDAYTLIQSLKQTAAPNDTIILIGSHYLLGEFYLEAMKRKKRFDFNNISV